MGEVYAAVDETLKRRVALKAVRPEHRLDTRARARFLREAQILSNLDHPNICRVYNYLETGGNDWLVLELIEGRTLRGALDGGLTAAQRLAIATQIAQVLVATHAAGVVHRDLKPGNVMITAAGDVKVLDFGLARSTPANDRLPDVEAEDDESARDAPTISDPFQGRATLSSLGENRPPAGASLPPPEAAHTRLPAPDEWATQAPSSLLETERGSVLGTLAYMSPEQARGETATTASDLYSFGLLLQELFTGLPPFDKADDSAALLDRASRGGVPPPKGIDTDLARLIQRLKSLAPAERPTAVDTLERLRWVAGKRARRAWRLGIAAALIVAVLGGLKYSVDLERERTAAVAARREADGRRGQAEDLIGFMLGDLRKKLETVGRLEILDDVGTKAMDYFAAVPESALTDHELADRAAALYQIGDVRITQGRLAEAVKPLAQSLALARMLADRHPNDGKRLYDLAQSHFWVGFVEWRQRRLDVALDHFREYLHLAERLVAIDPKNADWQLELASANSNIGSVLEEQGDLEGALERFRSTLAIESRLLAARPDDTTLRRAAASSNNAIGAVLRAQGRLDESLAHHRAELDLQEDLARREPGTARWRQYLSVSHNRVAMLLEAQGVLPEAARHAGEALLITDRLAADDASNLDWQRELGRSHYRVGVIALDRGAFTDALPHLRRAEAIMERAASLDALNPARQRDLADVRTALAQFALNRGDAAGAAREARAAREIADHLLHRSKDDRQALRLLGLSLELQGRALRRQGDRKGASDAWTLAVAALEPIARTSQDYAFVEPWVLALVGLGRLDDAREAARRLDAIGYRNPSFVRAVTGAGLVMPSPSTSVYH